MCAFLSNLPSYDKENFSDFQPGSHFECLLPRKQTFMASTRSPCGEYVTDDDTSTATLIVNSQSNLIIQYLERVSLAQLSQPSRGVKRDLNENVETNKQANKRTKQSEEDSSI